MLAYSQYYTVAIEARNVHYDKEKTMYTFIRMQSEADRTGNRKPCSKWTNWNMLVRWKKYWLSMLLLFVGVCVWERERTHTFSLIDCHACHSSTSVCTFFPLKVIAHKTNYVSFRRRWWMEGKKQEWERERARAKHWLIKIILK